MAQQFLSGVKITAGDENTLYLNTGSTGQEPAIFYQVNGSYKFEQRVGTNFELYNYTRSNWDFHLQGSTGYLALGHNAPGAGLHVKGTTNLASRFIFTKDLSTDKILFGGADHDTFGSPFIGSSSNHEFTIAQNGGAAITINTTKNVGIGVIAPSDGDSSIGNPRLHVKGADGSGRKLVARFQGASDSNDSYASIMINHANDRGLILSGGRASSNRAIGFLNLIQYDGNELTDGITLYQPNSAAAGDTAGTAVGIGTSSPGSRFEVLGGGTGTNDIDRYVRFKASNGEKRFDFYIGGTGNASRLSMYDSDGTTEGARISSSGKSFLNNGLGVGAASSYTANTSADELVVGDGTGHHGITIHTGTTHQGSIYFADDLDTEGAGDNPVGNRDGVFRYSQSDGHFQLRTAGNQIAATIKHNGSTFEGDVSAPRFQGKTYPYNTTVGHTANATTTYIVAGSTSQTSIELSGGDTNSNIIFKTPDSSNVEKTVLTLDTNQNATFAGDVVKAHEVITAGNQNGNNNGSGADGRYATGVLDLSHSGTPSNYRIETNIPFNSSGADFTIHIEGFRYGGRDPVSLIICWHIYPANTPYNHCVISNGGWSPVVKIARNTANNLTTLFIESPGYWPKMYVRSIHSSNYEIGAYAKGWTWSDATLASGYDIITTVPYQPLSLGNGGINNGGAINGDAITGTSLTSTGNVTINGGQLLTPSGVNLALNPNTGVATVGGVIQTSGTGNNTFSGNIALSSTGAATFSIENTNASQKWGQYVGSNDDYVFRDFTDTRSTLILHGDGDATFAGTVTASSYVGIPAGIGELFGKSVYLTTSTVGFLIETNIASNNYAMMTGTIKLEQFNVSTKQTIEFSATTLDTGAVQSKNGTADKQVTIKLFVYNSKWYVWVPAPSTYTTALANINLHNSYQGNGAANHGKNEVANITVSAVPSSGVSGSVDIQCDFSQGPIVIPGQVTINPDADSQVIIGNGGTNASTVFAGVGDDLYLGGNNNSNMRLFSGTAIQMYGTLAVDSHATFSADNTTNGIIRSAKNIVSNSTYNLISMHSTRTVDDYGGLGKNYIQMNLVTPGPNTDGNSSAHGFGSFSLKLADNAGSTSMGEVLNITAGGYAKIQNRLQVGKAGGAGNSGRLDLFGRYSNDKPRIFFKTDHPNNATQWDMAQIYAADGGNYNGQLYFQVASGNGSEGSGASLATALFIDDTKDATFYAKVYGTQFITSSNLNGTGDEGLGIGNGQRLGFDQSGTRSWTVKAAGGNINFFSGDGNGGLVTDLTDGLITNTINTRSGDLDIKTNSVSRDVRFYNGSGAVMMRVQGKGAIIDQTISTANQNELSWRSLTSYSYSTSQTPNTQYYYNKVARLATNSGTLMMEYYAQADVNYPRAASGRFTVSSWNNTTISVNHLESTAAVPIEVCVYVDDDRNVWIKGDNVVWDSRLYVRAVTATNVDLYYGSDTAKTLTQPSGSVEIKPGVAKRLSISDVSSTASGFTPTSNYVGTKHSVNQVEASFIESLGVNKASSFNVNTSSTVGIGASMGDVNAAELGPGYLSLSRDDTANAKQIMFEKNDAEHSYIQTEDSLLRIVAGASKHLYIDTNNGSSGMWRFTNSGIFQWGAGRGSLTWDTGYAKIHSTSSNELHIGTGTNTDSLRLAGDRIEDDKAVLSYQLGDVTFAQNKIENGKQDNTSGYHKMAEVTATRSGKVRVCFSAYIQSGNYYWSWRILKSGGSAYHKSNSVTFGSSHANGSDGTNAGSGYQNGLASGQSHSVHAYRDYQVDIKDVVAGETIEVWMASSTAAGGNVTGNGQYLYLKNFKLKSLTPVINNMAVVPGSLVIDTTSAVDLPTHYSALVLDGASTGGRQKIQFSVDGVQMAYLQKDNNNDLVYYLPSNKKHIFYGSGSERVNIGGDLSVVGSTDLLITGSNRRLQFTSGNGTIRAAASSAHLIFQTNGSTTALELKANQQAEFSADVKHQGLTMTEGNSVDQYKYFAMTFTLTANTWTDTGIDGSDLSTGTYAMQAYVSDFSVGGGHYYEYYSGMMSWYGDGTNSTKTDEIVVHRAGHAPNNGDVQFRTERHGSGTLMLQVKHNMSYTGALDDSSGGKIFRFKFRRLI